uniref:Uncharacterized protein n=1 Tax=Arundo donax TaxID=35708 RepID=A0A0A8Y4Y7_ARUDO
MQMSHCSCLFVGYFVHS